MTIGIVILNFLSYEDTVECVKSIEEQSISDYHVVIVDNGSNNDSYEILAEKYLNNERISVIETKKNLGYAKGNNVGIAFLKQIGIYNCLVINGDTIFTDSDYLQKLRDLQLPSSIGMVGTKIISKDGFNQNPMKVIFTKKDAVTKSKIEMFLLEVMYRSRVDVLISFFRRSTQISKKNSNVEESRKQILNPTKEKLHGAAIYFTENYLKEYIGFYPDTFLYYEEEFLALICREFGFEQMYIPDMSIFHKEDASSDMLMDENKRKSALFKINEVKKNIELIKKVLAMPTEELKKRMSP